MDWFHCNLCLARERNITSKYFLTQCQKVFCDKCLQKAITSCPKCGHNKCRYIELNKTANSDVQMLFRNITDSFKKWTQVESFQKRQTTHLIDKISEKYRQAINENHILRQKIDELKDHVRTLNDLLIKSRSSNVTLLPKKDISDTLIEDMFGKPNLKSVHRLLSDSDIDIDFLSPIPYHTMPMERDSGHASMTPRPPSPPQLSPLQSIRSKSKSKISVHQRPAIHPISSVKSSYSSSLHKMPPASHDVQRKALVHYTSTPCSGQSAHSKRSGLTTSSRSSSGVTSLSQLYYNNLHK